MQKKVCFVRHAKSAWDNPSQSDHDRPLNDRGLYDAPIMAEKLFQTGFRPDIIITSTAERAKITASYFSKIYQTNQIELAKLYHAEPETIMDLINYSDETISSMIIVGHNPGMTMVANYIAHGVTSNIPTCGIILASLPKDIKWREVDWNDFVLDKILTPKE